MRLGMVTLRDNEGQPNGDEPAATEALVRGMAADGFVKDLRHLHLLEQAEDERQIVNAVVGERGGEGGVGYTPPRYLVWARMACRFCGNALRGSQWFKSVNQLGNRYSAGYLIYKSPDCTRPPHSRL